MTFVSSNKANQVYAGTLDEGIVLVYTIILSHEAKKVHSQHWAGSSIAMARETLTMPISEGRMVVKNHTM